jgi:hypothetical protein
MLRNVLRKEKMVLTGTVLIFGLQVDLKFNWLSFMAWNL